MSRLLTRVALFAWILILNPLFCTSSSSFYDDKDCNDTLMLHCNRNLANNWPQNPKEFNVSKHIKVFTLEWKSSSKNLQCIRILVLRNGIINTCKILDFMRRNNTFEDESFKYKIEYNITDYKNDYVIEISSLPQRNSEAIRWNTIYYECSKWATHFKHIYDGDHINVTFAQGPKRCNFNNYTVTLRGEHHKQVSKEIVYEQVNKTNLTAVFSPHLCKGEYYINIVKTPEPIKDTSCKTHTGKDTSCNERRSPSQTFIPRIACDMIPAKPVPEKEEFNISFIIGLVCFLSIIAAVLLIIYIFKRHQCQRRKRGLVLFLDDYPAHTKAVLKLVDYLRECYFDIHLASHYLRHNEDRDQLIILSEALKSDFILLVISSAFQKRMEAWDKQQDYVEFFQDRNSNVLTRWFLKKLSLWNRLYLCKFDHVSDSHLWSGHCYSLPSRLTEMIKDLVGDDFKLPFLTHFQRKAMLEQLNNAVSKAADYEQSTLNWFHQKYFFPTTIATKENCFSESSSWT